MVNDSSMYCKFNKSKKYDIWLTKIYKKLLINFLESGKWFTINGKEEVLGCGINCPYSYKDCYALNGVIPDDKDATPYIISMYQGGEKLLNITWWKDIGWTYIGPDTCDESKFPMPSEVSEQRKNIELRSFRKYCYDINISKCLIEYIETFLD